MQTASPHPFREGPFSGQVVHSSTLLSTRGPRGLANALTDSASQTPVREGKVASSDGTLIAYEAHGNGPPLVLVDGALCSRSVGPMPMVATQLSGCFEVFLYDRRGRGESGDSPPYAVDREIEDLEAVLRLTGGRAFVYGWSAGGVLALRTAARAAGILRLAVYEPPLSEQVRVVEIAALLEAGRREDAVDAFLGIHGAALRSNTVAWSKMTAIAHTLPYDFAVLGDVGGGKPAADDLQPTMASLQTPALVAVGGKSSRSFCLAIERATGSIPQLQRRVIEGQTHRVSARAIARVLRQFFLA